MTDTGRTDKAPGTILGRTTLTGRALHNLAVCLIREVAEVSARDIRVSLTDANGGLQAEVTVPVSLGAGSEKTLTERGAVVREAVAQGMERLAGRRVAAVDIRFSGVQRIQEKRVK